MIREMAAPKSCADAQRVVQKLEELISQERLNASKAYFEKGSR